MKFCLSKSTGTTVTRNPSCSCCDMTQSLILTITSKLPQVPRVLTSAFWSLIVVIKDTLYYVNVKLFVDPAFSFDINKRHFVFTKVFSKSYWPHIILLDLGVASWIRVLSVRFQLLSLRLQLTLHHLLNKYRDPIKHQPRSEKPAENTNVAQLRPSLLY